MRHDKVCAHLHYLICKTLDTDTTDKWHTHAHSTQHTHTAHTHTAHTAHNTQHTHTQMPKPVCKEGDVIVLWNIKQYTQTEKLQQIGQI